MAREKVIKKAIKISFLLLIIATLFPMEEDSQYTTTLTLAEDTTPPTISNVTIDGQAVTSLTTNEESVVVAGECTDDLSTPDKITLSVRSESYWSEVIGLASDGGFEVDFPLSGGTNIITLTARDEAGNETTMSLTVTRPASVETYVVSVPAGYIINVLIPPDASVLSARLLGTSGIDELTEFRYKGSFSLRCYKFAQMTAVFRGYSESSRIEVEVQVRRNPASYVPCGADALADNIIERLVSCPTSGNVSIASPISGSASLWPSSSDNDLLEQRAGDGLERTPTTTPTLSFGNLEMASEWKGYPVLSVDKEQSYQLPQQSVDYVVITSIEMLPLLDSFLEWKHAQGFTTFVMTTQTIDDIYGGSSLQLKTREFLNDAFNEWHMEYVLIVGGAGMLPPISYQVISDSGTDDITTDYFYMTLEQPADAFSEDYTTAHFFPADFPDFVLGRFPSDNSLELQNMMQKTITYEQTTNLGEWVRTSLLVLGEDLSYASNWDEYTTDRPKLMLVYPENLTLQALVDLFSQGMGSICMNTHASPYGWMLGGGEYLDYDTVDRLSNSRLPVVFSTGCHSGKFDASHSVAVKMLGKSAGGVVAIVAGTSYTPPGIPVYFSAYNYWEKCLETHQRLPNADYHIGKAFFYYAVLNNITKHMILLGDPSLVLATANYDLPVNFPVNTPPSLTSGSASPSSGAPGTAFTYTVTYTDVDGDTPLSMSVFIDGVEHSMSYAGGTYTDGATYSYTTSTLGTGSHTYYFWARDTHATVRLPTSGSYSGPTMVLETPTGDTDGDGMPDTWESQYGLNPNLNDAGQDADGDGYTNLQEYQSGTNPKLASSYPAASGQTTPGGTTEPFPQWILLAIVGIVIGGVMAIVITILVKKFW